MSINILIADDDALLSLISDFAKSQGYTPIKARNGKEALDIFFLI